MSFTTAWVSAVLVFVTLSLGPWKVLCRAANPVSTDLRRDVGIWAGIVALAHSGVGLLVHFRGRPWLYFFEPSGPRPRFSAFGLANWLGLAGTVVIAGLLALSNDWMLRRLGSSRWKALQRWNYGLFVLIVLHGLIYQVLVEDRDRILVLLFGAAIIVVAGLQVAGYRTERADRR